MSFTLPDLPYAYDALAPHMSAETLEFHHDKHHNAYLTVMNEMIAGTDYASMSIEDIVRKSYSDNPKLFNQAAQYYNHVHFWNWMAPSGGGSVPGALAAKINEDLGSMEKTARSIHRRWKDTVRIRMGLALPERRKAGSHQFAERGEPARSWRCANSRRRCLGTLVLHRLPQRPARLS